MGTLKKSLQTLGSIAAVGGLLAAAPVPAIAQKNPCSPGAKKAANPCSPGAKANPCGAKPAAKKASNPCGANPCAAKKK